MYKDFEDFMQTKHAEQYQGLDDEMPDDFNEWLQDVDIDDWLLYGELYSQIKVKEELKKMAKIIQEFRQSMGLEVNNG